MSRLYVFGTSCGIEPVQGRRHTAFALEHEGSLYWFDAGENCGYAAAEMGVRLSRLRGMFISHAHMDHVGGLADLLWYLRRQTALGDPVTGRLPLVIPEPEAAACILRLLQITDEGFRNPFEICVRKTEDGLVYSDGDVRISALHNTHKRLPDGTSVSFGYLVELGALRIVYTGDTGGVEDYAPLLPCDVLITESGHNPAWRTAKALRERGLLPPRLLFLHHGYEILRDEAAQLRRTQEYAPAAVFLKDGDILELK